MGIGVSVGVGVGVCVGEGVDVGEGVYVCVGVDVGMGVGVCVGEGVDVGKGVYVCVGVDVGMGVSVCVGVGVDVGVGSGVDVGVGVDVGESADASATLSIGSDPGDARSGASASPHAASHTTASAANSPASPARQEIFRNLPIYSSTMRQTLARRAEYSPNARTCKRRRNESTCPGLVGAQNPDVVSALNSHSGERRNPVRSATATGDFRNQRLPIWDRLWG